MDYGEHQCLACRSHVIPVYRVFCKWCFGAVPWKLRAEVMNAYRVRVYRRPVFDRAMRALRQWKDGG